MKTISGLIAKSPNITASGKSVKKKEGGVYETLEFGSPEEIRTQIMEIWL
ncbi:MAG: hypothetical protein V1915_01395 [Candidatus Bathyarchaeota archaeon]